MIYGMSYLGGAKFPKILAANHPAGWAGKFFLNEFGDARPAARGLLITGKCPSLMYHLMYKSDHSFSLADLPAVSNAANSLVTQVTNFPGTEFRISPACEHNLSSVDAATFIDTAMKPFSGLSNVIPVNNPLTMAGHIPGVVTEFHCGGTPPPEVLLYPFDYDGCSAFDADNVKDLASFSSAQIFYFWIPQFNGRKTTNDTTPIGQRTAWPIPQLFPAIEHLVTPKGATKLPSTSLWKSVDEQSNVPPVGRELKPVCIIPDNVPDVQIKCLSGQLLATSSPPLPFSSGGYRYYFSDFGFHYADLATKLSGNPLVNIFVNGKIIGTVNPGFRENDYRS
jgi:hypothetical protein